MGYKRTLNPKPYKGLRKAQMVPTWHVLRSAERFRVEGGSFVVPVGFVVLLGKPKGPRTQIKGF